MTDHVGGGDAGRVEHGDGVLGERARRVAPRLAEVAGADAPVVEDDDAEVLGQCVGERTPAVHAGRLSGDEEDGDAGPPLGEGDARPVVGDGVVGHERTA